MPGRILSSDCYSSPGNWACPSPNKMSPDTLWFLMYLPHQRKLPHRDVAVSGIQLRSWIYLRTVKTRKSHNCVMCLHQGHKWILMSTWLPFSASSGSGTLKALPVWNPMLDPAFSSCVLYCLEINFSLSVTLTVSLGMLLGRGRLQFPTLVAATRAPAAASSWPGPWLELLHGTGLASWWLRK